MGDTRFLEAYERIRDSLNRARELRSLTDESIIGALAAASRELDPFMANVLATEAMNRARRAKAIAASIAEGVLTIDVNARVGYANPMAERLLGLPREEIVGRPLREALRPSLEDGSDLDLARELESVYDNEAGPPLEREDVLFTRADGERFPVSCSMSLVKSDDAIAGVVLAFRDITERKLADARLQESLERYRLLAENITDIVVVARPDGHVEFVSPSCWNILQREPQELLGFRWGSLVHPEDRATMEAARARRGAGETWTNTMRVKRRDGSYVWLESTARDVQDGNGGRVTVAVARDVTERRNAEAALRASEERYRLLAENMSDLVTLSDAEGRILYASPSSRRLLGYDPEELAGRALNDLVASDDPAALVGFTRALASRGPGAGTLTFRVRHARGGHRWLEAKVRQVRAADDGEVDCLVSVFRDATARVEAENARREFEARYRLVAEHAHDMVCTTTPEGELTYASPACRRILGYEPHELVGRHATDFIHPADVSEFLNERARLLATATGGLAHVRFRHKNGDYVQLETSESVVTDEQTQRPLCVVGICRDVARRGPHASTAISEEA